MKRARFIGTTEEAICTEEVKLRRVLPVSFRSWLLENNGLSIGSIHVYPVFDERDPRKTWDSLHHNYCNGWAAWLENFDDECRDFSFLLPFADFGSGDYYCFDYRAATVEGEWLIVRWSHETGEVDKRAQTFTEFIISAMKGAFKND